MARSRAVVVAILAAASLGGWRLGTARRTATAAYTVVAVHDGDTIEVARGGERDTVRLLGVDTPETRHPTRPVECFGPEAAAYTTRRLTGRSVRLEDDVEARDRYDRRLAYVIVDGERFNDQLLRLGYAELLVIEPNHAHARAMLRAELEAKRAGRGLWGEC
ncbi:MAG TPA: thermonuclease family protein [Acidimicrobiia bacterium]